MVKQRKKPATATPKGVGPPCLYEGEKMGTGTFRRTDSQAAKLEALGGGAWIREQIDRAKLK